MPIARPGLLTATGKFAAATVALAVAAAIYAIAGAATSASLTLTGTISPKCEFTTVPGPANFAMTNGVIDIGDLGYTCNLPDGSNASFILQITNGGLKNGETGTVVPYDVQWNIPDNDGSQAWQDAATFLSGVSFSWPTSSAGVERIGLFRIRITAPLSGLPAGSYGSVVTYTISP
jgi:hypothetical protein